MSRVALALVALALVGCSHDRVELSRSNWGCWLYADQRPVEITPQCVVYVDLSWLLEVQRQTTESKP